MDIEQEFNALGDTSTQRLLNMMKRLRDPDSGCPWDKEQTFASIAPYTIEEAYEVSDAIDREDMKDLKSELGDLLLQVVFHAQIADDEALFNFDQVCDELVRKMVRRHPHVFGSDKERDSKTQTQAWEAIKAQERASTENTRTLDGVALSLPALQRAKKLQNRAARVGFDWPAIDPVLLKVTEEVQEIIDARDNGESQERIHEEVGDLLFVIANVARHLKIDPEHALRDANAKFVKRFAYIEDNAEPDINALDLEAMDALWEKAKREGL